MFDEIKEGLMAEPDGWWVDAKDFYGPDATKVGGGSGQELELTPQRRRLSEVEGAQAEQMMQSVSKRLRRLQNTGQRPRWLR